MNENIKYDKHGEEWDKMLNDEERKKIALTWLHQDNTLDRWRHDRMYRLVKPIIEFNKFFKWLTVGDGRYGTDANALGKLGAEKVFCSDISDKLLKIGNQTGFIKEFAAENAESLSFSEAQFDFVFCKESYHHFPRPYIALHEMLRVSKIGVVLIEPRDYKIGVKLVNFILSKLKKLLGKKVNSEGHDFETVGNYVYLVSERELEKVQLGMHRRFIAYNYINDHYEAGFEFIQLDTSVNLHKFKIFKAKTLILIKNILMRLGLYSPGMLASVLFKDKPDEELLILLKKNGWKIKELPQNPYI